MVEPLLALAGALPGGGLSDAAIRSIGRPAGQGGRFAPWQFSALAGLLSARERARKPLSIDLDQPFASLWESARRLVPDDTAVEAERVAAVSLLRPLGSERRQRSRPARRIAPAAARRRDPAGGRHEPGLRRRSPGGRSPAGRLEGSFPADPRDRPRRAPQPPRVDRHAALGPGSRPHLARRDRPRATRAAHPAPRSGAPGEGRGPVRAPGSGAPGRRRVVSDRRCG